MDSDSSESDNDTGCCLGRCGVHTFVVIASIFIFATSLALVGYLTSLERIRFALVVLIVSSSLIFLLTFFSNMYSIYFIRPTRRPSENDEDSNQSTQASSQSISTNPRYPDIVRVSRSRMRFRNTPPPPPSEIQMSVIQPGPSRTTESSAQEAEIAEEARKLIRRLYEELKRTGQQSQPSSIDKQPVQQRVRTPSIPVTPQERASPKVLHQNLVVQKQQPVLKSSPSRGLPDNFRTNQVLQQKVRSPLPTQLDAGRLINGNEARNAAAASQISPHIPNRPIEGSDRNQGVKQKLTPTNSLTCHSDLRKITLDSNGCAVTSPQISHQREGFVKAAHKRKLSQSQDLQRRPKTLGGNTHMPAAKSYSKTNVYEEIDDVESIHSANSSLASSHPVDYYTQSEYDNSSEPTSVESAGCEPSPARRIGIPNVKERRQLSLLSTRKFFQLGQSPEILLDAIGSCFDLTPDEWMNAWKLSREGVPPDERARILGVRLQEGFLENNN